MTKRIYREDVEVAKKTRQDYFSEFSTYHREWLRELVAKYKDRGMFPIFPTQIIEYYSDDADKEVAIISTFCMDWNKNELEQIAVLRDMMGEHPYEWYKSRSFVTLGIGKNQGRRLEGNPAVSYWKIAKLFSILYDMCHGRNVSVLKRGGLANFCKKVKEVCNFPNMEYKRGVVELVLRTSDGIGRNLWATDPQKVKSPVTSKIRAFIRLWFPDVDSKWTFDESVSLFCLEYDYDMFYAYLAYQELCRVNPVECRKYLTRYQSRWKTGAYYRRCEWSGSRNIMPEINF